ncbi:MAG: hypothetical protein ACFFDW_06880 [Candidatus Thorarchaeota archaeon]
MSTDDYDDEEFEEEDEEEEWEYFEEEEKKSFRDRVSIWDIVKLVVLFIAFAGFFLYFRFWNFLTNLLAFSGEQELGQSRLIYFTLVFFPFAATLFITGLVKVSRTLFIPPKETPVEE